MGRTFLWKSLVVFFGCAVIAFTAGAGYVNAASLGQTVANVQIKDGENEPATIPDFGTHVIGLTYADTDAKDLGDPFANASKAKKYDKAVYRGLGVANLKDSNLPDFAIRMAVRDKVKQFNAIILTDVDLTLPKAWGLGDVNDKSVFILIGKDKKIKYLKYADKKNPWTPAEVSAAIKLIDDLIKK